MLHIHTLYNSVVLLNLHGQRCLCWLGPMLEMAHAWTDLERAVAMQFLNIGIMGL